MKTYAFRLTKGEDLKVCIEKFVVEHQIQAGVILSSVGCLDKAVIRNAGGVECMTIQKPLEICQVDGTLSVDGCHLHITVSDETLKTYGGHLKDGCIVNTTAEVVLLELDHYKFTRQMDSATGYKELVIQEQ